MRNVPPDRYGNERYCMRVSEMPSCGRMLWSRGSSDRKVLQAMSQFYFRRRGWIKLGRLGIRYRNTAYSYVNDTHEHRWRKVFFVFWWGSDIKRKARLRAGTMTPRMPDYVKLPKHKPPVLECPFCCEDDFDLVGLKGHLLHDCTGFAEIEAPTRVFGSHSGTDSSHG